MFPRELEVKYVELLPSSEEDTEGTVQAIARFPTPSQCERAVAVELGSLGEGVSVTAELAGPEIEASVFERMIAAQEAKRQRTDDAPPAAAPFRTTPGCLLHVTGLVRLLLSGLECHKNLNTQSHIKSTP